MADSFLRLDLDTLEHPKIVRLMTQYGDRGYVSLQRLWINAAKFNPESGRFDGSAKELSAIARAPGKPGEFIAFLVEVRLLDLDGETYSVHNWVDREPFFADAPARKARNTRNANKRWAQPDEPTGNEEGNGESKRQQAQALVDSWNATVTRLPKVEKLNAQRIAHVCARLKEHSPEEMVALFKRLDDSDLAQKWGSFDWVTKSEFNLSKLSEGQYDNHRGANGAGAPVRPMPTGAEYLKTLENSN